MDSGERTMGQHLGCLSLIVIFGGGWLAFGIKEQLVVLV